jgi:hypothetical protein
MVRAKSWHSSEEVLNLKYTFSGGPLAFRTIVVYTLAVMEHTQTENAVVNPSAGLAASLRQTAMRGYTSLGLFALLAVSAFATDPPPDWEATLTGARTDITELLTTYGPLVVSLMVFVFGFRFIVRWIFRAMGGL